MMVLEYDYYNNIIEDFSKIKESKKSKFQHDGQTVNSLQPNPPDKSQFREMIKLIYHESTINISFIYRHNLYENQHTTITLTCLVKKTNKILKMQTNLKNPEYRKQK